MEPTYTLQDTHRYVVNDFLTIMTRNGHSALLMKVRLEDVCLSTLTSIIPEGRIDPLYNILCSQGTHVVCVNFIREWRDLEFNIGSERQIYFFFFCEIFSWQILFFTLRVFVRNLLRGSRRRNKNRHFFIFRFEPEPGLYV